MQKGLSHNLDDNHDTNCSTESRLSFNLTILLRWRNWGEGEGWIIGLGWSLAFQTRVCNDHDRQMQPQGSGTCAPEIFQVEFLTLRVYDAFFLLCVTY